ncbi:MAG: hypothetical protein RLO17_12745 [Cyclobacteriaceae bacterium]
MDYYGNRDILQNHKVGFLCSRRCPAEIVLKSYDWAKEQRVNGVTVICGNHSQIEKDVFEILLKGKQPLILVLARGRMKLWPDTIIPEVEKGRLLVIAPFEEKVTRVSTTTAETRNRHITELSDQLVVGYVARGGMLEKILAQEVWDSL